jgi:class 3 adenylate cyclase
MNTRNQMLELRLMLEELACDLCRFEHGGDNHANLEEVLIRREMPLGDGRGFADILITPKSGNPYFVEVKSGYSGKEVLGSLRRKYGQPLPNDFASCDRIILLVDTEGRADLDSLIKQIQSSLGSRFHLEVWDEATLCEKVKCHFGVSISKIAPGILIDVRAAIDHAKGLYAFGEEPSDASVHAPLRAQLLWNFSFWRLRHFRAGGLGIRQILEPGVYCGVVVLLADLCSFSSYVRDTSDPEIMRGNLTSFYSKARYEILNNGGMLYQFVGDEVIALFGMPDQPDGYVEAAYRTARALCSVGKSVSEEWQKQIDRVQSQTGIHVGMALGDVHLMPLRPFSRTHCGFIADSINVAARLMNEGTADQIVVTNGLYSRLDEESRQQFTALEPVDARNVGKIRAWKAQVAG